MREPQSPKKSHIMHPLNPPKTMKIMQIAWFTAKRSSDF